MQKCLKIICLIIFSILFFSCKEDTNPKQNEAAPENKIQQTEIRQYQKYIKSVEPFFELMGEPSENEWLASFPEEGQTFEQYINAGPTLPTEKRNKIYIQPLGKFDKKQLRVIETTAKYMESFFDLPVELLKVEKFDEPLSLENYRIHPAWKAKQIRTGYVIDDILSPKLPGDAAAMIAFTDENLYPDENFNFVFGQASFEKRVGVWSLYYLDDDKNDKTFLERTLKIAVHETGHMFSMKHCTKYKCVMSGTNGLDETDTRPIDACPECMAKIVWMRKSDPKKRFENLSAFCKNAGLSEDAKLFTEKAQAISGEK